MVVSGASSLCDGVYQSQGIAASPVCLVDTCGCRCGTGFICESKYYSDAMERMIVSGALSLCDATPTKYAKASQLAPFALSTPVDASRTLAAEQVSFAKANKLISRELAQAVGTTVTVGLVCKQANGVFPRRLREECAHSHSFVLRW